MTAFMTVIPGVEAPELTPRTARLLDTVEPTDGIEWADPAPNGGSIYTSLACMGLGQSSDICKTPVLAGAYQSAVGVNSFRFTTDIGIQCQSLAFGSNDLEGQFERVVDLRESDQVELNLMALRFTGTVGGAAAVDLTPAGGAYGIDCGLATLEGHAAANYAGRPIIHAPVTVASVMAADPNFKTVGKRMYTGLGNPFVAGGGYEAKIGPSGAVAAAGEWWLYASGVLRIRRSRRMQLEPQLDRSTNIYYLRSQRAYVIDVDCYLAAVRVKF